MGVWGCMGISSISVYSLAELMLKLYLERVMVKSIIVMYLVL